MHTNSLGLLREIVASKAEGASGIEKIYTKAIRLLYEKETENLVSALNIQKEVKDILDRMCDEIQSFEISQRGQSEVR